MAKPKVNTNAVADLYASPGERIIEFNTGKNATDPGGLISLNHIDSGELMVSVYRTDPGVSVIVSSEIPTFIDGINASALVAWLRALTEEERGLLGLNETSPS